MERPYEQIRRMVKLFEYNRLKLRFRNEDERARFIDGWAERFCETDDAEWNIAVTIMTARRREPNFYNMEKALREAQGRLAFQKFAFWYSVGLMPVSFLKVPEK